MKVIIWCLLLASLLAGGCQGAKKPASILEVDPLFMPSYGAATDDEILTVTNTSAHEVEFMATTPQDWIQVTPPGGTLAAGECKTPTVGVAGTYDFPADTYSGTILVSAETTAKTVRVSLTIQNRPLNYYRPGENYFSDPLSFRAGYSQQALQFSSRNLNSLSWTIVCGRPWLSVFPTSGLVGSQRTTVTFTADWDQLELGMNETYFRVGTDLGTDTMDVEARLAVESLSLSPPWSRIDVGESIQLQALAECTDGRTRDVTAAVSWDCLDPTVGLISLGMFHAQARGAAAITAKWIPKDLTSYYDNEVTARDPVRVVAGGTLFTATTALWQSTDWSPAHSPYILLGDVQVPPGITLSMAPGTQIMYGQDSGILVMGNLLAEGTATSRIQFGPLPKTNGYTPSYTPLNFSDNPNLDSCRLRFVDMKLRGEGILITGTSSAHSLVVSDSNFFSLYTDSGYNYSPAAIHASLPHLTIRMERCHLDRVGLGIYKGATILDSNRVTGSILSLGGMAQVSACSFTGASLSLDDGGSYWISQCDISGPPTGVGLNGPQTGTNTLIVVDHCRIAGAKTGLALGKNTCFTLINSVITGNQVGLETRYSGWVSPLIANNNFGGNTQYTIRNQSARSDGDLTVAGNFWGTAIPEAIESLLYDYTDDITLGRLLTTPFLIEPVASAGPQ